ncbi:MAG: hypothetical protein DMF62_00305 [Acidobacteria bacterium]|nr:MAG: hypothetical protein DMF62_00305 [Acidobacteriota bacterium]
MKYCPTCKTRYDEEILRFCMKDGTPLIDEAEPKFTTMPSASIGQEDDDPGEVTIIRKKGEVPIPPPEMDEEGAFIPPEPEYRPQEPVFRPKEEQAPRFIVPMETPAQQARVIPPYQAPPKSNTVKVVVLTIFGTVALLVVGGLGFWAISRGLSRGSEASNANNANANVLINTNLGFDANFNFNGSNTLFNSNATTNSNVKSPTPSPKPSPSPSPSATATPDDDQTPTPTPRPSASVPSMLPMNRPSPTPPRMLPMNRPPVNRPNNTE